MDTCTHEDIVNAGLADWRDLDSGMHARFETGDFATGLALVTAIGAAAEEVNHHPDVTLTYPHVDIRLISHDAGGITPRDVELARRISDLAQEHGISAAPPADL